MSLTILELRRWANERVRSYDSQALKTVQHAMIIARFRSVSAPSILYSVTKRGDHLECNCPGYTYKRRCRHLDEVLC
jgi:hypothetical protein